MRRMQVQEQEELEARMRENAGGPEPDNCEGGGGGPKGEEGRRASGTGPRGGEQ